MRDLIEATTLYQARVAAQQVEGSVSRRIRPIKEQLLELIALLEAGIDFAEDDVSVAPAEEILRRIGPDRARALGAGSTTFDYGKLVHSGITLAIVGRPNVGKSSLFNRLLEQDRAIVTDIPGTTRDLVSEVAAIQGIPVKFVDTAGIRAGQDLVEKLGIERSYQAMADADVTLVVLDLSAPVHPDDLALIERAKSQGRYILVGNKSDLPRRADTARRVHRRLGAHRRGHRSNCAIRSHPLAAREQDSGIHHQHPARAVAARKHRSAGPGRAKPPNSASRTRCCCWISTPRCALLTPSPGPPPRTIF